MRREDKIKRVSMPSGPTTDRELLLLLKKDVDNLGSQNKDIIERLDKLENKIVTSDRIRGIETSVHDIQTNKLDKETFDKPDKLDLEKRIRALENWRWYTLGVMGVLIFLIEMFKK